MQPDQQVKALIMHPSLSLFRGKDYVHHEQDSCLPQQVNKGSIIILDMPIN